MSDDRLEPANLTEYLRGVPTICVDAALGATWLGNSIRLTVGEAVFNPHGETNGYRATANVVLTLEAARGLIEYLQTLPGLGDEQA